MLESLSISTDCVLCLTDRDKVYNKISRKLKLYDRRQIKRGGGVLDRQVYEEGVLQVVQDVLARTDPFLVNLVETKVAWGVSLPIDTSVHIQMSSSIRALLKTNPACAEVYH